MVLVRVGEQVFYEISNVIIGQAVEDVFPFSCPIEQLRVRQHLESMGDEGQGIARFFLELRNAMSPLQQQRQQAQAPGLAKGRSHAGRALDLAITQCGVAVLGVIGGGAGCVHHVI